MQVQIHQELSIKKELLTEIEQKLLEKEVEEILEEYDLIFKQQFAIYKFAPMVLNFINSEVRRNQVNLDRDEMKKEIREKIEIIGNSETSPEWIMEIKELLENYDLIFDHEYQKFLNMRRTSEGTGVHSRTEQKPEERMNVFGLSKEGFKVIEGKNCQLQFNSSIEKYHPNNYRFGGIKDLAEYTKIPGEENKFGTYNGEIKVFQPKQRVKGEENKRNRRGFIEKVKYIISSNFNISVEDEGKKDFEKREEGKGVEK